jgi:hypothetical protein
MKGLFLVMKKFLEKRYGAEIVTSDQRYYVINEAVNLDRKAIFIAIPKTGTTSVRRQMKQRGIPIVPNPHLNILQVRDLIYVHLLKITLGGNRAFPNNEVPDDLALRQEAQKIFDACFKFSAVRNPWARAVSLYFRREGITTNERISFEEFCQQHLYASDTCRQPTMHKNQYDWLCNEKGENQMDYIYKVENFDQAIHEIRELTHGRLVLKNVEKNRNPGSQSMNYRDMYNDVTRKLIGTRFEKDIDIFKYTF